MNRERHGIAPVHSSAPHVDETHARDEPRETPPNKGLNLTRVSLRSTRAG